MRKVRFTNATMFALVMQQKDLGIKFLSRILEREVKDIHFVDAIDMTTEKSIIVAIESKSVRIDVLFEDDDDWYAVEMQIRDEKNVPKRSRYIHGSMDLDHLRRGSEYNSLKKSYVIFVCCFDPIGAGAAKYSFEMYDREKNLRLGDESYTIIVNTTADDAPEHFRSLFEYINEDHATPDDSLVMEIDSFVGNMNDKGVGDAIMTIQDIIDKTKAQAEEALAMAKKASAEAEEAAARRDEAIAREKEATAREKEATAREKEAIARANEADDNAKAIGKQLQDVKETILKQVRDGSLTAKLAAQILHSSEEEIQELLK